MRETPGELQVAYASRDGSTRVSVDAQVSAQFEGSALFANLEEASKFFQKDSAGFSATHDRDRLDGLRLSTSSWPVRPVHIRAARSTFFDDLHQFPPGSAILDCALLMRAVPATWSPLAPMLTPELRLSLPGPPPRRVLPRGEGEVDSTRFR